MKSYIWHITRIFFILTIHPTDISSRNQHKYNGFISINTGLCVRACEFLRVYDYELQFNRIYVEF